MSSDWKNSKHFMIDLETLGVESTSVVLSVGIIQFSPDEVPNWTDFLYRSMFVKFSVADQVNNHHRSMDVDTCKWWGKQSDIVKAKSFKPGIYDLEASHGLDVIRGYCHLDKDSAKNDDVTFWARGNLDQSCLSSLSKAVCGDELIPYGNWMDVRTALALTKETCVNGYCDVPGFDRGKVHKHDPVQDCALDLMQLLGGK